MFIAALFTVAKIWKQPAVAAAKSLQSYPTLCDPDSVRPHRRQPTRLPRPWDSQGKNTGVGCHFLLQCMKVKSESEVVQSCLTLRDPMDSSVYGIFQARVLEWGAIAFSAITSYFLYLYLSFFCVSVYWDYNNYHASIFNYSPNISCDLNLLL